MTTQNRSTIVAAIAADTPVSIMYAARNGITSVRTIRPRTIERCANGSAIVRAFDTHREAPRSFTLDGIRMAVSA